MTLPIYVVDAFTEARFAGNPAAVCPLETWLPDATMQSIAAENNLSETAFFVPEQGGYRLRWFTPTVEVDLCGHATLASAFVISTFLAPETRRMVFQTRSGELSVTREQAFLTLDFPTLAPQPVDRMEQVAAALGFAPREVLAAGKCMAVLDSAARVENAAPDLEKIAALPELGLIITAPGAPGTEHDFVSRYFTPQGGIPEDPVTGSAHCLLAPFWAQRLGKTELRARQVSARGGDLVCRMDGDRVLISGRAVLYLEGVIHV